MATNIINSVISNDQEKFLVNKLLDRSSIRLVMGGLCDNISMREGAGLTAYMVRYKRMFVPLATLSEATTPTQSTFSLEQVTVTLDQWGDYLEISDVAQLTAKHPLMTQCVELLADNAARVMDREITIVMLAGTTVQYADGSVSTRNTLTSAMVISDTIVQKVRVTMVSAGAPPRGGPSGDARAVATSGNFQNGNSYVAVCGPQVIGDVQRPSTSFGTWASAATYANAKALYASEVGTWQGVRFVETNFIPKFTLLGDTTAANVSGGDFGTNTPVVTAVDGGGALNSGVTYFYKVTRKDKLRGFEEEISIAHSTASAATGNNESFTFNFSGLTAGYVYNLYFDTVQGGGTGSDVTLGLVAANIEVGITTTVTAVPAATTNPPASLRNVLDGADPAAIHPVFIVAEAALAWAGFYKSRVMMSPTGATKDDPLAQRRTVGYKFFGKAVIKDQTRLLRLEVASAY
jgi:N4-gp56 family major capsid protein